MHHRKIQNTSVSLTELGFGASVIGTLYRVTPADDATAAVDAAMVVRAGAIAEVCEAHGTTLPAAAIAFPRTHPSIINVTLGMRTPEQVRRNVELHDQHVPNGLWDDLRAQGLIRSDVLLGHGGGSDSRCL